MNYAVIVEHLLSRGHAVTLEQVEEAELRARVRLDPHLAPGNSTESTTTHGRYLRYLLEYLTVTDEAEIDAIARWRRGYNLPVGLWPRSAECERRGWWPGSSPTPTARCAPSWRRPGSPRISTSSSTRR